MRRNLAVAALLVGLSACQRGAPAPVTPLPTAPAPTNQAPQAPVAAPSPVQSPANPPSEAPSRAATQRASQDTLKEQAFLDSLHSLSSDSLRQSQPVPITQPVAPEAVKREADSLFGRPNGGAAAITYDIDVASYAAHERVQYWVDFFTGRARWHFERYLERLGRYDSIIRGELAAAGMPRDMIYLAMIESGFNHLARSRVGAVGLWQFMPSTARRYGLVVDGWVDERRDPFIETGAAVRFLSELNSRFGSWYLAAAAYDAGPGKIQKGLARGDYESLSRNDAYFAMAEGNFLRRETRDYVPKLIAAALIAKEPAKYGFGGLDRWTPLRFDSIQVNYAIGLDVIARLAGVPRDDIEEMNPAFFRGVTPPDRTVWVRLPVGIADSMRTRLAALPEKDRVTFIAHAVARGETLNKIAAMYGVTVNDIKSANHLHSNMLTRGQRLVIPTSGSRTWRHSIARMREEDPVRRGRTRTATRRPAASRTTASARTGAPSRAPAGTTRRVHIVKSGESLWTISSQFHVSVTSLMQANGLGKRSLLHPGQAVRIP